MTHIYAISRYRARKKYYSKEENKQKKRDYMKEYIKRDYVQKKYECHRFVNCEQFPDISLEMKGFQRRVPELWYGWRRFLPVD